MIQDAIFGLCIHTGERVVEHQDARAADQGSRNGGALFLPAGKREAPLPDQGVVAIGKTLDLIGIPICSTREWPKAAPTIARSRRSDFKPNAARFGRRRI